MQSADRVNRHNFKMDAKTKEERELYSVRMLGLQLPTDPRWVNLAEKDLEEILTDHA